MSDLTEDILARLEIQLGSVSGINNVFRDRGELAKAALPAIVLLDGRTNLIQDVRSRKTVRMPPALFVLQTQVWLALVPRDDVTNLTVGGASAPVGPELSYYRVLIRGAVENDPTLVSLLTTSGQIEYHGCETDMAIGSSMVGNMMMRYDFVHPLFPPRS